MVWKHEWKVVVLSLIALICCIANVIKKSESWWIKYRFSWLDEKQKRKEVNPIKDDHKCFQYAADHEHIEKNLQKIWKIKLFINRFNWKGINYPSRKNAWENFEKNNPSMAANALYVKRMNVCPACK